MPIELRSLLKIIEGTTIKIPYYEGKDDKKIKKFIKEKSIKIVNEDGVIYTYDKNGNMIVRQLDNNLSIKEGDVVFTSGLTNKYPSGITIGYVSRIENNSYDTGKILYISLYYDINDIKYVSFLKRMI